MIMKRLKNGQEQELDSGYKPALKTKINNIKSYDIVFIGYPIWWGTFAAPVKTFLSEYDFSGKTIVPFCTHGGSGPGQNPSFFHEGYQCQRIAENLFQNQSRA
jgi:flavodoxin